MPEPGRILGLDFGDVRIGVAVSDPNRRIAVPLGTVRAGSPGDLEAIAKLISELDVALVVVGHPLHMSGEAGMRAGQAETFAETLHAFLGMTVVLHDERLSTVEADRALKAAGAKPRRRRRAVDRSAAAVILQSYLDGLHAD